MTCDCIDMHGPRDIATITHLSQVASYTHNRSKPQRSLTQRMEIFTQNAAWITWVFVAAHVLLQGFLVLRVIMLQRAVGETLAWILIIVFFWFIGPVLYLIIGERRLGRRRAMRVVELFKPVRKWLDELPGRHMISWDDRGIEAEPLSRLGEHAIGMPALPGNQIELLEDWQTTFLRLIEDIDRAERTCHLEFYIWNNGGEVDRIVEALIRARQRGVAIRVLVDDMGSHKFLRSKHAKEMRAAGIELSSALPGGLFRLLFVRFDIRLHRKIIVIDGRVAYTGSLNMVDPRYFKQEAGVGQWVDAMIRMEGPAVEALAITFLADWYCETDADITQLRVSGDATPQPLVGDATAQVLPSGPAFATDAIEQFVLSAIYAARREIVLTSPYFVPNESLQVALASASRRGVKVILVVPAKVDSRLVRYASQAFKGELLESGVRVAHFTGGLLHTKSIAVDDEFSLFGSLNLDPRSFHLNFEISVAIYDRAFTKQLRELHQQYLDVSELMDLATWRRRPFSTRLAEGFARLLGPVL